jgi:glycogen(starch) synthase
MNILMFGWEFPPYISGGLGTACAGLTKGLDAVGGVRTTFVLPSGPYRASNEHFVDSIRFVEIEAAADQAAAPRPSSYSGASLTGEAMRYAGSAARMLGTAGAFDVIHAHDWLTYLAGVHAKKVSGKPLVVHVHSTEFDRSGETYNKDIYKIERLGMDMADRIVAVSNYTRDIIIARYGQDPDKIVTIYNATEKHAVSRPDRSGAIERPLVTFLGRITYQKGPEYFIEAARMVLQRGKDVSFVMAGDGDLLPRMKSLVAALGIADHFTFPGFLDAAGVAELFARSDVYVMPSVSEPFGIAALEAINAQVPTIISSNCGLAELVDSVIKLAPDDCAGIADAIVRLIDDPAYALRLAAGASGELRKVSWDESAGSLKGLYAELVAEPS